MDVKIIYQDDLFIVYDPEILEEYLSIWNYAITDTSTWNEWKTNYKYIYPIISKKFAGKGYLYVPDNNTFSSNIDNTDLQRYTFDTFVKQYSGVGNFLLQLSYNILLEGENCVVRQEKLTTQKKTNVIIYDTSRVYIYTAQSAKMNAGMKKYLKNNKDVCEFLKQFINPVILEEIL